MHFKLLKYFLQIDYTYYTYYSHKRLSPHQRIIHKRTDTLTYALFTLSKQKMCSKNIFLTLYWNFFYSFNHESLFIIIQEEKKIIIKLKTIINIVARILFFLKRVLHTGVEMIVKLLYIYYYNNTINVKDCII